MVAEGAGVGVEALDAMWDACAAAACCIVDKVPALTHTDPTPRLKMLLPITRITELPSLTFQTSKHTSPTHLSILIIRSLTFTLPHIITYPMVILIAVETFGGVAADAADCAGDAGFVVLGVVVDAFAAVRELVVLPEVAGIAGLAAVQIEAL